MSIRPITRRQAAFAKAFVRTGGNQTRAAIEAGYSPKNQHAYGHRLLRNDAVLAAIMADVATGAPGSEAALRRLQLAYRSPEIRVRAEALRSSETVPAKIVGDDRPLVVVDQDAAALRDHVVKHAGALGFTPLGTETRYEARPARRKRHQSSQLTQLGNRVSDAVPSENEVQR